MENTIQDTETRMYELSYLLVPTLDEETATGKAVEELKKLISEKGGTIFDEEAPRMIPLAYEMRPTIMNKNYRFSEGYFGWIKFDMIGEDTIVLRDALRLSETVFRFMIIHTVRESVVRKVTIRSEARRSKKDDEVLADALEEGAVQEEVVVDAPVEEETVVVETAVE